jgi:hypothetical protein
MINQIVDVCTIYLPHTRNPKNSSSESSQREKSEGLRTKVRSIAAYSVHRFSSPKQAERAKCLLGSFASFSHEMSYYLVILN